MKTGESAVSAPAATRTDANPSSDTRENRAIPGRNSHAASPISATAATDPGNISRRSDFTFPRSPRAVQMASQRENGITRIASGNASTFAISSIGRTAPRSSADTHDGTTQSDSTAWTTSELRAARKTSSVHFQNLKLAFFSDTIRRVSSRHRDVSPQPIPRLPLTRVRLL